MTVSTLFSDNGVKMNLLYLQEDGKTWKADKDNYVTLNKDGEYVASVHHFSSFAPGFETSIEKKTDNEAKVESDKYAGKSFKNAENLQLTAMVEKGMVYNGSSALEATKAKLNGKAEVTQHYIAGLLEAKIKADNAGICPADTTFGAKVPKILEFAARNEYSIDHLTLTTTYENKSYSILVEGEEIIVYVKIARSYTVTVNYTQTHAGHGTDLNAGGGIVDFE